MMNASSTANAAHSQAGTHLVVIPSYNTGRDLLEKTVRSAHSQWPHVWLFIDGSTDGSGEHLKSLEPALPGLRVCIARQNRGKGATLEWAAAEAAAAGFTHALAMDADGQHPAESIPEFMDVSRQCPEALILGQPRFGPEVPLERYFGRRIGIGFTQLETLWGGLGDTLFGFRIYPLAPLQAVFRQTRTGARGYDFDPEAAVRLFWMGVRPVPLKAPVRYLSKEEGGISHYRYGRDTLRMIALHCRLLPQMLPRLHRIAAYSRRWRQKNTTVQA